MKANFFNIEKVSRNSHNFNFENIGQQPEGNPGSQEALAPSKYHIVARGALRWANGAARSGFWTYGHEHVRSYQGKEKPAAWVQSEADDVSGSKVHRSHAPKWHLSSRHQTWKYSDHRWHCQTGRFWFLSWDLLQTTVHRVHLNEVVQAARVPADRWLLQP